MCDFVLTKVQHKCLRELNTVLEHSFTSLKNADWNSSGMFIIRDGLEISIDLCVEYNLFMQ